MYEVINFSRFQILAILLNVDKTKVDVTIGRTPIHGDKPVALAWNNEQKNMSAVKEEQSKFDIILPIHIVYKTAKMNALEIMNKGLFK